MMKVPPSFSCSLAPSVRAIRSVDPPGGNGTSRVTGFEGHACAWAPAARTRPRRPKVRVARCLRMAMSPAMLVYVDLAEFRLFARPGARLFAQADAEPRAGRHQHASILDLQ